MPNVMRTPSIGWLRDLPWPSMVTTFGISLVIQAVYFNYGLHRVNYNSDSVSYFIHVDILNGIVDLYRTPFYPILIDALKTISGPSLVRDLIAIQHLAFATSVSLLVGIMISHGISRPIALAAGLMMALDRDLLEQVININPELFTVLCSVVAIGAFCSVSTKLTIPKGSALGLMCFLFVMVKPVYVWLFLSGLLYFTIRPVTGRATSRSLAHVGGILAYIIVFGTAYSGYAYLNLQCHGSFTVSRISVHNTIANAVVSGSYKEIDAVEASYAARKVIDGHLEEDVYPVVFSLDSYILGTYAEAMNRLPPEIDRSGNVVSYRQFEHLLRDRSMTFAEVDRFLNMCRAEKSYWLYLLVRARVMLSNDFFRYMLIILVASVILGLNIRRTRGMSTLAAFCTLALAGMLTTLLVVVGEFNSPTSFRVAQPDRLMVPALPFYYVLASYILHTGWIALNESKGWSSHPE